MEDTKLNGRLKHIRDEKKELNDMEYQIFDYGKYFIDKENTYFMNTFVRKWEGAS